MNPCCWTVIFSHSFSLHLTFSLCLPCVFRNQEHTPTQHDLFFFSFISNRLAHCNTKNTVLFTAYCNVSFWEMLFELSEGWMKWGRCVLVIWNCHYLLACLDVCHSIMALHICCTYIICFACTIHNQRRTFKHIHIWVPIEKLWKISNVNHFRILFIHLQSILNCLHTTPLWDHRLPFSSSG